jgi:hypothetical protein
MLEQGIRGNRYVVGVIKPVEKYIDFVSTDYSTCPNRRSEAPPAKLKLATTGFEVHYSIR